MNNRHALYIGLIMLCRLLSAPWTEGGENAPMPSAAAAMLLNFEAERIMDAARPGSTVKIEPSGDLLRKDSTHASRFLLLGGNNRVLLSPLADTARKALAGSFTLELDVRVDNPAVSGRPTIIEVLDPANKPVLTLRSSMAYAPHPTGRPEILFTTTSGKSGSLLMKWHEDAAIRMCQNIIPRLWFHVAITVEPGKRLCLYIDGVQCGSKPLAAAIAPAAAIRIGGGASTAFSGAIDNLRLTPGILYNPKTSGQAKKAGQIRLREESRKTWERLLKPESSAWAKAHPRLLFTRASLPALKERLKAGRGPELVGRLIADCEAWTDPESAQYYDPKKYTLEQDRYWMMKPALMCLATALSGDPKYARRAGVIAKAYADHLGYNNTANFLARCAYSAGTVMMMALSYDWGYEYFTPAQRGAIRESLMELAAGVHTQLALPETEKLWVLNWRAMSISSLGFATLAIAGEVNAPISKWLSRAEREAAQYGNFAVGRDGGFHEGHAYFVYGTQHILVLMEALRVAAGLDLFRRTNISRVPDFLCYLMLPWGEEMMPMRYARPGGGNPTNRHVLMLYRDRIRSQSAQWLWQKIYKQDKYPEFCQTFGMLWYRPESRLLADPGLPLARHFRDVHMVAFRTGWGRDDVAGIFYAHIARLLAHDQLDRGQFMLYGHGGRWVIDSGGRGQAHCAPRDAHNLVVVDGETTMQNTGQNYHVDSWITDFCHDDQIATAAGADLAPSYCYSYNWAMEPVNLKRKKFQVERFDHAVRHLLFVRGPEAPPYLLVLDDLDKDGKEHDYTWYLHTDGKNEVTLDKNRAILHQPVLATDFLYHPMQPGWLPGPAGKHTQGYAEYDVQVPADGRYTLWGFGRAGDQTPGGMDSFFITFADCKHLAWSAGGDYDYKWLPISSKPLALKRGPQVLRVQMREPEARVARFALVPEKGTVLKISGHDLARNVMIDATKPTRIKPPFAIGRETVKLFPEAWMDLALLTPATNLTAEPFQPETLDLHTRLQASVRAKRAQFLAFLYPRGPGMPQAVPQPVAGAAVTPAWRVVWKACEDVILIDSGHGIQYRDLASDAAMLVLRFRRNRLVSWIMMNGTRLQSGQTCIITLKGSRGTAMFRAGRLAVSGPGVYGFAANIPGRTRAFAHNRPIKLKRTPAGLEPASILQPEPQLRW